MNSINPVKMIALGRMMEIVAMKTMNVPVIIDAVMNRVMMITAGIVIADMVKMAIPVDNRDKYYQEYTRDHRSHPDGLSFG